jgi:hypothetical protein
MKNNTRMGIPRFTDAKRSEQDDTIQQTVAAGNRKGGHFLPPHPFHFADFTVYYL